jgi:hypothetical protein
MALLEDILPQIRAGRKARRKGWPISAVTQFNDDESYNDSEIMADDWELVKEKNKAWLILYVSGAVVHFENAEEALAYSKIKSPGAKVIETRKIEWSVE